VDGEWGDEMLGDENGGYAWHFEQWLSLNDVGTVTAVAKCITCQQKTLSPLDHIIPQGY
jgi:hypothetical protein